MKTLPYTAENGQQIALHQGLTAHEVATNAAISADLGMPVLAVLDFEPFGYKYRGTVNPHVKFIGVELFDKHYEHTEPEVPGQWRECRVKEGEHG